MTAYNFPANIFTSQKRFNDYQASDMKCGDLTDSQLRRVYGLAHISNLVDPYNMTSVSLFNSPQSRFAGAYGNRPGSPISRAECARLLFDEMRATSLPFSFFGPNRHLINTMLYHLQGNSGTPFINVGLNLAYQNRIVSDRAESSTIEIIRKVISKNVDAKKRCLNDDFLSLVKVGLETSRLPKFDSNLDRINGLGITVHDVYATRIDLIALDIGDHSWRARLKYTAQDHFGLDDDDICNPLFRQFQFFKIWFILQRLEKFGFRPYMTNMEAIINIDGGIG